MSSIPDTHSIDYDTSPVQREERGHACYRSCLTGAISPQESEKLTVLNRERQIIDGDNLAELFN